MSADPGSRNAEGPAIEVRKTEVALPAEGVGFRAAAELSTNTVTVGGNALITVKIVNTGKKEVVLDRNSLSVHVSVTDARHKPVAEIPFMDEMVEAGRASRLVVPTGAGTVVRIFGVQVTKGEWRGFGTSGEYKGVGLVVHRDAGSSCYPLKEIPGEYFLCCHLRVEAPKTSGQHGQEIVSDEIKVSVKE